ncbi:cation-binding protein [Pilimelia terevasa]|uniref:Cation-binding protein n=1 Tax=Pilimelia terevasa TaxID=53372 RepID=A0A8J3BTB2_9ACTN|nr:hemerythrin domain-containing protein [Pilimelia terevasa]GGK40129.1 cation-binding protein [Pilimelia terevasa]
MDDITHLILADHHAFRLGFARLDDARGADELRAVWEPLALHLEVHAEAEERILYPHLLRRGGDEADEETDDAIRDHNKIRDAVAATRDHEIGTDDWWAAVWSARRENSEHLAEEEDEALPDFRRHVDRTLRLDLGRQWLRFYGDHPQGAGLTMRDKDPAAYIAAHR